MTRPSNHAGRAAGNGGWCRSLIAPLLAAVGLLGAATSQSEEIERGKNASSVPAKVHGRWPNDARDTFWYGDHETASRVARASGRPLFLVLNRGAVCEV
jgi:hypothetical protein